MRSSSDSLHFPRSVVHTEVEKLAGGASSPPSACLLPSAATAGCSPGETPPASPSHFQESEGEPWPSGRAEVGLFGERGRREGWSCGTGWAVIGSDL